MHLFHPAIAETVLQQLQKQFTGKDVVWLTIDSSAEGKEGYLTPEEANKQVAEWKMKSTALLLDPTGKVGHEYAATNTPHMYVVDPSGKLIYSGAIDDKPSTNPDDVAGATNYVKAALTEAMEGKPVATPTSRAAPPSCSSTIPLSPTAP